jgi:uncharacterized protein
MATASFRFAEALAPFLCREHRDGEFAHPCARAATLKNAIEALGVPHTEIGALYVNGEPATLQRIVRQGDTVEVREYQVRDAGDARFLADAHLGGLARFLRMLGFDTLHDPAFADEEIRRLAHDDARIVLTRDRELLKCREVARGCYVRSLRVEDQLREVVARYALAQRAEPFTLCLLCNVRLQTATDVKDRVPPRVLEAHDTFKHCARCDRIYWPGTHYERMCSVLNKTAGVPCSNPGHVRSSGSAQ